MAGGRGGRAGTPPGGHADWADRRAYDASRQRRLFDAGYAGMGRPKEYGGRFPSTIMFTSGSRGTRKGIVHTHGNALRAVAAGLPAR
ncbi:hypothetical protein BJF79_01990 [Actinomadura sp. CNU-125]|nr:hypothetical protein BJF79_01990 [Actinomadura sp. CNU-125]